MLEDLESFVFEVDGSEADGLELAQDAGDFAGFATEAPLAGEAGEIQGFPSIDEGGETAEIEAGVEFDGVGLKSGFGGKSRSDEVRTSGGSLEILQMVRERGPLGVRKDLRTRWEV